MLYLLSNAENLIWSEIQTYTDKVEKPTHSVEFIKHMIECYVFLSRENNQPTPYNNVKEFFCVYDTDGNLKKEYNKFISCKSVIEESFESDNALFWISYIESDTCKLIQNVFTDSETDPHYSAVYATNTIKCIIHLMKELGQKIPYSDVKGFFDCHNFSEEEYKAFELSREKESVYYRGIQY